jgi:hypothetical protein
MVKYEVTYKIKTTTFNKINCTDDIIDIIEMESLSELGDIVRYLNENKLSRHNANQEIIVSFFRRI